MFPSIARNSGPESPLSQRAAASVNFTAMHNSEFQELPLYAEDRPQEECGVFGIYAPGVDVARRTFFGIFALQHRGQESAGIAVSDGNAMNVHTAMGLVSQVFDQDTLDGLIGDIAVGHTRYSTTGSSLACNAQPILINSPDGEMALAHNGNLVNASVLREELEAQGVQFSTSMDTEVMGRLIENCGDCTLEEALINMMRRVQGAYSLAMMTRDTLIALRDPNGVRPLCLGPTQRRRRQRLCYRQ